jgi:hypothetical protein
MTGWGFFRGYIERRHDLEDCELGIIADQPRRALCYLNIGSDHVFSIGSLEGAGY